jgi:hypothetical protein
MNSDHRKGAFQCQIRLTDSQKVRKRPYSSFRRKPESRDFEKFWTPAFAGVTAWETFYEAVKKLLENWSIGVSKRRFMVQGAGCTAEPLLMATPVFLRGVILINPNVA